MRRAATLTLLALAGSVLAQGVGSAEAVKIKAVLLTRTTAFLKTPSGILLPRRASLEPFMIDEIKGALTEAMAKLEEASGGKVKAQLYLTEDAEHILDIHTPDELGYGIGDSKQPFGGLSRIHDLRYQPSRQRGAFFAQALSDGAASLVNSDSFDAIDGAYRGPFQAVFVIHPGLDGPTDFYRFDGQPAWSIGWNTFSREKPKDALKQTILDRLSNLSPAYQSLKAPAYKPTLGAFGEIESVQKDGVISAKSTGVIPRGGINIASIDVPDLSGISLKFKLRTPSQEPLALSIVDDEGRLLHWSLLKGSIPGLSGTYGEIRRQDGTAVQAGPEWTDYSISLDGAKFQGKAAFLQIGPPPIPFERGPIEQTSFEIQAVQLVGASEAAMTVAPSVPSALEAEVTAWSASLAQGWDDAKIQKFNELLASPLAWVRSTAMDAAAQKPDPRLIGPLRAQAGQGSISDSYLACRALGEIGAEGQASLADVLKKGPFETNRRFAAGFLKMPLERGVLNTVSVLLVNRGWRTRQAAALLLSESKAKEDQVALAGALDFRTEPHPAVRLVIAQACDVTFELAARRLLYSAINDPSQWVRAAGLIRLLDCPNAEIRAEAIKGVADDSPTVRVLLLDAMRAKPSPDYRASLRQAVTDKHAKVRAAALRAFIVQPDPVAQGEIENTLKDDSEEVQLALVELGKSGKFRLPNETAESLKKSPHDSVRAAAETLPGS